MSKAVDHVCNILYDQILSGQFKPGRRLGEAELTEMTGVSRTPVREALRRLTREGFVEIESNRGAFIPEYTKRDLDEIFGMRTLLEGHAARRAASRITPEQLARMEEINAEFRKLIEGDAKRDGSAMVRDVTQLNWDFHEVILEAADNANLRKMIHQLARIALSARTFERLGEDGRKDSVNGHEDLIRALRAGHPDWAEAVMRHHVHTARQSMASEQPE